MEYIKQNLSTIIILGLFVTYILYQRIPIYLANRKLESKKLENIKFETLSGEIFHLDDLKNKIVLINFWATWCMPCKLEMPILESLHKELGDDLTIIGITNENKEVVESYLKDKNITYKIVLDETYKLANYFNVQGYPTLILIKNGVIKEVTTGFNPIIKWKIQWYVKRSIF
ncbi:MAG: TlpA family protein disulfide reductase [Leptonema sp. (in: bacteria)]